MASIKTLGIDVVINNDTKGLKDYNFKNFALFTRDLGNTIFQSGISKYEVDNLDDIIKKFGENHGVTKALTVHFSQDKKADNVTIYPFYKTQLVIAESTSKILGGVVKGSLALLKTINNGYIAFKLGSDDIVISNIDLTQASNTTLQKTAEALQAAVRTNSNLTNAVVSYNQDKDTFTIDSKTSKQITTVTTSANAEGFYLGDLLSLESPTAYVVDAVSAVTKQAESVVKAVSRAVDINNDIYGIAFAESLTNDELEAVAGYVETQDYKLFVYSVNDLSNTTLLETINKLRTKSLKRTAVVYDPNDAYVHIAYLTIAVSNDYNLNRQAGTLKFKTLIGITADNIKDSDVKRARRYNINAYSDVRAKGLTLDGFNINGDFTDTHTLVDYIKANIQLKVTNYLSNNHVFLNNDGQSELIAVIKAFLNQVSNNGYISSNIWKRGQIGNLKHGDNIENGYYIYSEDLNKLSTEDRNTRTTQPIYIALSFSGYIHNVQIIISYSK